MRMHKLFAKFANRLPSRPLLQCRLNSVMASQAASFQSLAADSSDSALKGDGPVACQTRSRDARLVGRPLPSAFNDRCSTPSPQMRMRSRSSRQCPRSRLQPMRPKR